MKRVKGIPRVVPCAFDTYVIREIETECGRIIEREVLEIIPGSHWKNRVRVPKRKLTNQGDSNGQPDGNHH